MLNSANWFTCERFPSIRDLHSDAAPDLRSEEKVLIRIRLQKNDSDPPHWSKTTGMLNVPVLVYFLIGDVDPYMDPDPGSESRIRIQIQGEKRSFPEKNAKLKFPNVNYNSNFCHACSRTFTVQYMSWIRIHISPYGSGSSFYYTDPDPRIRIHITVFNKGVYF